MEGEVLRFVESAQYGYDCEDYHDHELLPIEFKEDVDVVECLVYIMNSAQY